MASRRDMFQSYQFMVQRVISGIVLRETDPLQTPLRKMSGSGFASLMIAVVALAGTGLIGLFFKSSDSTWKEADAVIIEEESGATFVYLDLTDNDEDDKLLYPTANFSSAALLARKPDFVTVSHQSLLEATRGPELGIIDAPDSLPLPDLMLEGEWTLCSLAAETVSGEVTPNTALVVGVGTSSGADVSETAVVVRDIEVETLHLVWKGRQYPINNENAVLEGLILRNETEVEVGTAWLNALPVGRALQPNPVPGLGAPSNVIPGALVGEVRVVEEGGNRQYYQVATDTIVEITEVQSAILRADPLVRDTVYGGIPTDAQPLPASAVSDADRVPLDPPLPTDPPVDIPDPATIASEKPTICASFESDQAAPVISIEAAVDGVRDSGETQQETEAGTVLADLVVVEPGHGTIVEGRASPSATTGTLYLITDEGRRYKLASADAQAFLGYQGFTPLVLPESLIARIPAGSTLDRAAALIPVG